MRQCIENPSMVKILLCILVLLSFPFPILSADNSIAISHGTPANYQKKQIKVIDFIYDRQIKFLDFSSVTSGVSGRVGNIELDGENGTRVGVGSYFAIEYPMFDGGALVNVSLPFGVLLIDKNRYAETGKIRNYGGRIQFTYGLEISYGFAATPIELVYRFEHMSNAYRYKYNPGLDTHNFGIKLSF